ncbi:hypothetical protein BHE74_00025973 [Ensete ventricosum]|nr:hypothetical protein BHE74_00025973 [Ensete ventricosum]RZR85507.1 hypothetical protein BHM03_00012510 [Ensete ventricosum]
MVACSTYLSFSLVVPKGVLGAVHLGTALTRLACRPPVPQQLCISALVAASQVSSWVVARSSHLSVKYCDMFCRIATAVIEFEGGEPEIGRHPISRRLSKIGVD